jgi:hypothetical protein
LGARYRRPHYDDVLTVERGGDAVFGLFGVLEQRFGGEIQQHIVALDRCNESMLLP